MDSQAAEEARRAAAEEAEALAKASYPDWGPSLWRVRGFMV